MRTNSSPRGRFLVLILFIGSYLPIAGCNDESKTSGTMVQLSDEAKAQIEARKNMYKSKGATLKEKSKGINDKSKGRKTR